METDNKEF